ncbi:Glycerol dehydrogenase [Slackia heliotrinireducens]|nr:iron-containing alcohol dehydrogenase family protein [Slackia heliotrinireducens]VEH03305.1 Glycerol dehydrogenase [Slackia heliotrinireducens]
MSGEFVDKAYKMGAGRYLQEKGVITLLGSEVLLLGSKAFVLGGPCSYPLVRDAVESSFSAASAAFEAVTHEAPATRDDARRLADQALACGCDVIVGIGGGRMMDVAKTVSCSAGLPLIEVPTSIATCAAYTPLSVMYDAQGKADGVWRFTREVDAVIVDMDIMANQPPRLIAAGVLDAMAKMPEISNGGTGLTCDNSRVDRFAAYQYACINYDLLHRYGTQACQDAANGQVTEALERITFANMALTGIVSALTRGFHQTALAHRFYDGMRTFFGQDSKPWLHGELVAIGLIMQCTFNGAPDQAQELREFMRSMDMPCSLADIGFSGDDPRTAQVRDYVAHTEFVDDSPECQERFAQSFAKIIS